MSPIRRYISHDETAVIFELTLPTKNELREIFSEGRIEFATIRLKQKAPDGDFTCRVLENRNEREINYEEFKGYKNKFKEYDFVYDEISHSIYANGAFVRSISELSPLALLIRYFAENHYPSSSAEIAEDIYNSYDKKKASLVRQRVQDLREIHLDIIKNVSPYKRYILNNDLNTLFIFSD